MRLSSRTIRALFDGSEAAGLARDALTDGLGDDASRGLAGADADASVDGSVVFALAERIAILVDRDPERLRAVGRAMLRSPVFGPLHVLAEQLVSPAAFYETVLRWVVPATFPDLGVEVDVGGHRRLAFRASFVEERRASEPLLRLVEGFVAACAERHGLPGAKVVTREVDACRLEMLLELRESPSLEELRIVLDRFPDLVLVHREGRLVWANRALLVALGLAHVDEIVGKHLFDISLEKSHRELVARMRAAREGSPAAQEPIEVWLRGANGNAILAEVPPAQEVIWGSIPARLVVGRDVTERVRMQQRLVTADRLASVGLLGAGVAHEMNNPLAYVLVNVEMARKDLATMGDAGRRGHDALTIALEGVDRMRTIVRDLLVLSRGETVSTLPIDITAVVDSTLSLAAEEIRRKARLVRDLRPVPTVRATDARIAQIVLNLVSNALQAMLEGTPAENELVVVTRPAEDDRVLLEVRDNGVGIPAEHLSRVFEPFFTTYEGRGTGLGLPISQRLVVELGGEIVVSSSPAGGTAVRVFLPGAG